MSNAQTVQDLARQIAGNLATFSSAYPLLAGRVSKTAKFLAAGTPSYMRRAIITDVSTTIQWLLIHEGRVVVVTRPVVATNAAGDPIFLASLGDALHQSTPVSFPESAVTGQVVVLVMAKDHAALRLPGCAAVPGQLDPPDNADGSPSTEQASIDRLFFDVVGGTDHAPVFDVLPTIYPLALGETPVTQALASPFPADGNHSPGVRVWYHAMQYLEAHNGGFSLHAHPGLFAARDPPPTLFPTSS
jgi:hypothetical protein